MAHEQRAPEALRPSSEAEEPEQSGPVDGEARWPMAGAVIAAIVLTLLLPKQERPGPNWLLPLIEGLLLIALIVGDPGEISRRSRLLRALSIGLVAVLVVNALWQRGR